MVVKNYFKIGCLVPVIGLLGLLGSGIFAPDNALLVILSAILVRGGGGFVLGSTTVMLADVVDYGEYKLGTRNESIIFSCQTLLVKSASAFSGWAIGVGLQMMGYVANQEQSATTILGNARFNDSCTNRIYRIMLCNLQKILQIKR